MMPYRDFVDASWREFRCEGLPYSALVGVKDTFYNSMAEFCQLAALESQKMEAEFNDMVEITQVRVVALLT